MGFLYNLVNSAVKSRKKLEPISVPVVGLNYCQFDIENIGTPLKGYNMTPEEMARSKKFRFYQYYFNCDTTELIPEPNNVYDKNAIMVVVNGVKIGYIPAVKTAEVSEYLKIPCDYACNLTGGRYREVRPDLTVIDGSNPYSAGIKITPRD